MASEETRVNNEFLTDGDYLLEVSKFTTAVGKKPGSSSFKQAMVITEGSVIEVLKHRDAQKPEGHQGVPGSLAAGDTWVNIQTLQRGGPEWSLTENGEKALARVRSMVAAAASCEESDVTAEMCGTLAEGDGSAMKGMRIKVNVHTDFYTTAAGKKGQWTYYNWAPA